MAAVSAAGRRVPARTTGAAPRLPSVGRRGFRPGVAVPLLHPSAPARQRGPFPLPEAPFALKAPGGLGPRCALTSPRPLPPGGQRLCGPGPSARARPALRDAGCAGSVGGWGGGWQARCGAAGGRAGAAVLPPALVLKQCCGRIEKYVFAYLSTTSLALFPRTLISTAVQLT